MKNFSKVIRSEWNKPVREAQIEQGHPSPVEANAKPTDIHRDAGMLMHNLIYEELCEFRHALQDEDLEPSERLVEVADALGDMFYLLMGTASQYGLHEIFESIIDEIHSSNLTKLTNGKVKLREDGKVLKPSTFRKPELIKIINQAK